MLPKPPRFRDDQTLLSTFADEVLVTCPRCAACARIADAPHTQPAAALPARRFICAACGLTRMVEQNQQQMYTDSDQVFGYLLYLRVRCAGNLLWAYNYHHLAWMERYVRAALREARRDPQWGWSNASAANRLPAWMKSAKNRQAVLRGIAKLRRETASTAKNQSIG